MTNSVYKVLTPAGQFDAIFAEDEDTPIEYGGDELAISFFKDWLFINQISGSQGHLLDSDKLTPADLYGFCQPLNSGIEVIPPFDDFMSYTQEDIAMQTDKAVAESKILDGVYSDADKKSIAATNQLIKFFREFIASDFEKTQVPTAIYGWTATAQVMDKEDAKRRLRELIDIAINRKAGIEDITPKQKQRLDDYRHDARVISDYLTKRIRHTGARNLLNVPEMKKKYPYIDNQPREEYDSVEVRSNGDADHATLDAAISGAQKLKLVKELRDIRAGITSATSGIEKLKMVKRVNEIRKALGVEVAPNNDNQAEKAGNDIDDVNAVMPLLKRFIGEAQLSAVMSGIRSEEGQFFIDKMIEIANTIQNMPQTYEQDGKGDDAIAYLHYFKGSGDWYITEKDMEDEQIQAFGLADIFGDVGELGYINIEEIIQHGVELDFYWTPNTLRQIEGTGNGNENQNTEVGGESEEVQKSTENSDAIPPVEDEKSGFVSDLESLKTETDINRFNERLDEIAARIEQAGLMESLDKELNDAADVLTALLSAAESSGK